MASNNNPLSSAEQQALIWPIQAKGAVTRLQPAGDPAVETVYHNSMEQGRYLESSIADANNWLLQKKVLLNEYIISYTHMNQLAIDGQLGHHPRIPKYIADGISILQTAQRLTQEIVQLVQAIQKNIQMIQTIEQSMLKMVQNTLNAIANLLNNICNWGLPSLPSIPNLFPDQLWNWNGFQFSPLALFAMAESNATAASAFSFNKSNTTFSFNFTLGQCSVGMPSSPSSSSSSTPATTATVSNPFTANPVTVTSYSGLTFGSASYFTPPFDGTVVSPTQDLSDPAFIATMQANVTSPVFNTTFNPLTNMWGAMPDPHYIISNWQPSADTLDTYIVSIVPALRGNTVFVSDSDYSDPNFALRDLQLRKDLIRFVNLGNIVNSNFDPLLTAAWLFYLNLARQGRGGVWIPNFQTAYTNYIQPSVSIITTLATLWNNVLGETNFFWMGTWDSTISYAANDVVTYNSGIWQALVANVDVTPGTDATMWETAPQSAVYQNVPMIPLLGTFAGLAPNQLNHLLWQLSYVEASLLGYSRNAQWDAFQDNTYLTGATGADLDYQPTGISTLTTTLTLGVGTAEFPAPITFPNSFLTTMTQVIALASADIQADTTYLSPRLGNRYTYNQFAVATQVDRFSQFWRDFATNLTAFLAQDPYLVQFAATYPEILNGAVNPLGSPTAYNSLLLDVASRNRAWTPGTPLPTIPIQPITIPPSSFQPDLNNNGWINNMDFNPAAFLARPDIQALPIPTQIAMLRTNLSYAGINLWKSNMQASIATSLANANALLEATQQIGFHVSIYTTVTSVPPGNTGAPVAFDPLQLPQDFDYSGNYTNPTTFTIQSTGTYAGLGTVVWDVSGLGVVTVTVLQNSMAIATVSTTATAAGTYSTAFSFTGNFTQGDVVQVIATTNYATAQSVEPGTQFSMIQTGPTTPIVPLDNTDDTKTFTIDPTLPAWVTVPIPALTAMDIDANGDARPIDPFVPAITNIAITSNVLTVTTGGHHFVAGDLVVFSGVGVASFLDGQVVTVLSAGLTGTVFTANFTHADYASAADTGSVLYAIDSSGAVLAPIPDGVLLAQAGAGASATIGTFYGGVYAFSGATFTPGALLYAGLGGILTQDYTSLTTGVPNSAIGPVGWVICVGRAISVTEFIYEPHVPTRFSSII